MPEIKGEIWKLTHLADLWDSAAAEKLSSNPLGLLCYRSNLLGADLRITNFGGGNTSSKMDLPDPFTGKPTRVLAVKGSGGDLGSIKESGFALLYQDRLEQLKDLYRGERRNEVPELSHGRQYITRAIWAARLLRIQGLGGR